MLLARKGYKVLLLDKAAFPSDTLSTHFIHQPGVARLKKWGLLDKVIECIRGHTIGGATVTEKARIVIGADGMRSFVARRVQAQTYNERGTLTCMVYSYWRDLPLEGAKLYPRPGNMTIMFPTNDEQSVIGIFWPNSEFARIRGDIEGYFYRALEMIPGLEERVRAAKRSERFNGTPELPNFFRQATGPGWALVGDAGYHKDPILAQGITDSFRDAELLATALDDGFSGRRRMEDALAEYARQRDAQAAHGYEITCQFAMLQPPPPEIQQLMAAL
jgi:2-polyprenyl-6-methoxyphenol hydroxylase-like FAD-dependent oxidoreductase